MSPLCQRRTHDRRENLMRLPFVGLFCDIRAALEEVRFMPYSGLTRHLLPLRAIADLARGVFSAKAVRAVKVADRSSSIHPGPVHIAFFGSRED
jgi:hypothetical protein